MVRFILHILCAFLLSFLMGNAIGEVYKVVLDDSVLSWTMLISWAAVFGFELYATLWLVTKYIWPFTVERWGKLK